MVGKPPAAPQLFVLTFDGRVYREADLTIDDAERIEEAAGCSWLQINPLRYAKHARAILETFLITREDFTPEEAAKKVRALKVNEYLDLLTYEDADADLPSEYSDGFPQPADGHSTRT